jgi:aspartyl/glutamyl-tRNA(Asn/Gln) amidotransferase C subunit
MAGKSDFNVEEIANLAKLELEEGAKERIRENMAEIVGYVEELSRLDLSGVDPMYHSSDVKNVYRDDLAMPSFNRDRMLSNAPETVDGELVKVPAVLPDEEQ